MIRLSRSAIDSDSLLIKVEGEVEGPSADFLESTCREALQSSPSLCLDISGLRYADAAGVATLARLRRLAVEIQGASPLFTESLNEALDSGCSDRRTERVLDRLEPLLPVAYRIAFSVTGDPETASAAVVEAASRACRRTDWMAGVGSERFRFLRLVAEVLAAGGSDAPPLPGSLPGSTAAARWSELPEGSPPSSELILEALAALPLDLRLALCLVLVGRLSCDEVARILSWSPKMASDSVRRARAMLRSLLVAA